MKMDLVKLDPDAPLGKDRTMASAEVLNNEEKTRFEITVDGEPAGFADYRQAPREVRSFLKTEVDPAYRGQGLGGQLIKAALDSTRDSGLGVLPYCPAFQSFITKNPEYLDLVPQDRRAEFELPAE
ncbi:hypothetical protein GCM10023354_12400 [Garicola koreensis]